MNRPWHVWCGFAAALAVVLAAMAWVSAAVLRLERDAEAAAAGAAVEEDVRLALWRIDTTLAAMVAQENARPYFAYDAFYPAGVPARPTKGQPTTDEHLVASPLLVCPPPHMRLYFQFDVEHGLTSPQVPRTELRELAEWQLGDSQRLAAKTEELQRFGEHFDAARLLASLPPVPAEATVLLAQSIDPSNDQELLAPSQAGPDPFGQQAAPQPNQSDPFQQAANEPDLRQTANAPPTPRQQAAQQPVPQQQAEGPAQFLNPSQQTVRQSGENQSRINRREFAQRAAGYSQLNLGNWAAANTIHSAGDVGVGVIRPIWVGDELLLARRVSSNGSEVLQGSWVDWPALCASLLAGVADLLPGASLTPMASASGGETGRRLAALPIELSPGPAPRMVTSGLTAIQFSLALAWGGMLLAAVAVAALLSGVLTLSERRAAFVSAVTHELRTPLTTFRMYAEMLAGGMVPAEEQRRQYLDTLRIEADRLSHLVENVLSYARLERGRPRGRLEAIPLGDLLDRLAGRLRDRAQQANMHFEVVASDDARAASCRADGSVVEQVLFNLVDNACKYGHTPTVAEAASAGAHPMTDNASRGMIHLEASASDDTVQLRVRDAGPGITPAEGRKLFRPFSKSAHEAARTAPGVGLGLALSRRLARELGGDLRLEQGTTRGASFLLSLPRA
jgi:signal transduction histidine kinase